MSFWSPYRLISLSFIMDKLDAGRIVWAITGIGNFGQSLPERDVMAAWRPGAGINLESNTYNDLFERIEFLCVELEKLDLDVSLISATRLRELFRKAVPSTGFGAMIQSSLQLQPIQAAEIKELCTNLQGRISDQLMARTALTIPSKMVEYYSQTQPPFGGDVQTKFPVIIDEIAEASKCYALERSTASVFHSIRCLEAGISALSRCLGIPDPTRAVDRNWGKVLGNVKAAIDRRWPGASTRMSGDGEFFDNAYAALAAMQNPWRNATMHLDQKYTQEEAKSIFEVVKGFMMRLSNRMDENGNPKV